MATLSNADKTKLSKEQQAQIAALKQQYSAAQAAGDQARMDAAHKQAEAIRSSAGYSGGASGTDYKKLGANQGGQTADQVKAWVDDYVATNWDPKKGWTNGYDVSMNSRSRANYIRQQMQANSDAWHTASPEDREMLHQQNVELSKLLGLGGDQKYDPATGKWYTWNTNVGYGEDLTPTMPNVVEAWKRFYGYTDEDINRWKNDSSRYYNFVDTRTAARNGVDESGGFTGAYTQFANGPYVSLLHWGSNNVNPGLYTDSYGDGWGWGEKGVGGDLVYDGLGNVIPQKPPLMNNQATSKYTKQFTAYPEYGVIQPNILNAAHPAQPKKTTGAYTGVRNGRVDADLYSGLRDLGTGYRPNTKDDENNIEGQRAYNNDPGVRAYRAKQRAWYSGGGSASPYEDYLDQMYNAALQAQLESLKMAYDRNVSELDVGVDQVNDAYTEQKRQTAGESARQAANWREMANAYGLNSGAIGQAGLAQRNQLQAQLNTLGAAQAAALTELQQKRTLLGQQYQAAINQAAAENDFKRISALYEEAVRAEEALRQQEQFYTKLTVDFAKSLLR